MKKKKMVKKISPKQGGMMGVKSIMKNMDKGMKSMGKKKKKGY